MYRDLYKLFEMRTANITLQHFASVSDGVLVSNHAECRSLLGQCIGLLTLSYFEDTGRTHSLSLTLVARRFHDIFVHVLLGNSLNFGIKDRSKDLSTFFVHADRFSECITK